MKLGIDGLKSKYLQLESLRNNLNNNKLLFKSPDAAFSTNKKKSFSFLGGGYSSLIDGSYIKYLLS
ncbi:Uncharacterised protein [Providencia rettgeri]|nr:Uncharacterised protein [Providencia rettgeri]